MSFLWHYCCEHSRRDIGEIGELRPHLHPRLGYKLVWLTTERFPERDAVGLTSMFIKCDRMKYRYEVLDAHTCEPFYDWCRRREIDGDKVSDLVAWSDCKPETWWVSEQPVPVRVDRMPIEKGATECSQPPS